MFFQDHRLFIVDSTKEAYGIVCEELPGKVISLFHGDFNGIAACSPEIGIV